MAKVIDTVIEAATAATDPVIEMLVASRMRVTRENYIALAYTEDSPELDAESEAIIREALGNYRAALAAARAIRRARRRR